MLQLTNFLSSFAASVERKLQNQQNITQVLDLKIKAIQDQLDEVKNSSFTSSGREKPTQADQLSPGNFKELCTTN